MPFLEIFDFDAQPATRKMATERATAALCEAFAVEPETVSLYFFAIAPEAYGHAGKYGDEAEAKRIFVKLHAYGRSRALRSAAAAKVTEALAAAYGTTAKAVVIYFFERDPNEVSHAGQLADA